MRLSHRSTIAAVTCGLALLLSGCTSQPSSVGTTAASSAAVGSGTSGSTPGPVARSGSAAGSGTVGSASTGSASGASAAASGSTPGPGATSAPATAAHAAQALQKAYTTVSARILPSVVEIRTRTGLGSGIVYDAAGHIVTNHHVVGDATTFAVRLSNGHSYQGSLTGSYPEGDLAVIKIDGAEHLHPARFGDSSQLQIGDIVLAVGNPLGLEGSVTEGIVSAVGRTMTEPPAGNQSGATLPNTIQTSAPINPGNSGGALVNLAGQVVGIPTLAATSGQEGGAAPGIGFAIPSNVVTGIADQIIEYGEVRNTHRAALGVQVTTVYDQRTGSPAGVGIVEVNPGGPAATAGLKAGQVVLAVDGTKTPTTAVLSEVLAQFQPGDQVSVTVSTRSGNQHTVTVTLGQLPAG